MARGAVQMAGTQYTSDLGAGGRKGLRKRVMTMFHKSVKQEDMSGKQWVHIFSDNRPCAPWLGGSIQCCLMLADTVMRTWQSGSPDLAQLLSGQYSQAQRLPVEHA